jgi:hypothetical protein
VHIVQARIVGCIHFKGIRATMYKEAEDHTAYCVGGAHPDCIKYNSDDLMLHLGFKVEQQALDFETLLWKMGRGEVVGSLKDLVRDVVVSTGTAAQLGDRISASQYDAGAAESPAATLEDAASLASSATTSNLSIALESPLAVHMSIEKPAAFCGGVDKAHVWPKKKCKGFEAQDPNNFLAFSKTLHSCFDGPHHGAPRIAIRPLAAAEPAAVPGRRQKVMVAVECQEADSRLVQWLGLVLKDGTQRVETSPGCTDFHTWVEPEDPRTFCNYLQRSYEATKQMWNTP